MYYQVLNLVGVRHQVVTLAHVLIIITSSKFNTAVVIQLYYLGTKFSTSVPYSSTRVHVLN
eukprot:SAG31_NODE_3557_length_4124_cov_8.785342_2_plen_61_part_00